MNKRINFILTFIILIGYQKSLAQADKPPYVSAVPKFTYAKTLPEQEQQLKTNPLLLRFIESRKKMASDKFRPIYHFISPESTMNDPNGLCFWQGNWHLFYQAYPPEDSRQHWGHAISKDLIHWRDLPYAIYPSPERAVFSGSTLVEDNRVIAMYHGTAVGNMVALSSDPLLLNWEKVTGKAVIPAKSTTGSSLPYSVFDPSIWKKDNMYYALSAGRTSTGPGGRPIRADYLFRSKDLAHWDYLHEFVQDDRFTLIGDDGACPYFWPIGDRYIMNFFSHMSGGQYLLGDYDKQKDKFIATSAGKYNQGAVSPSGVHAPSAAPDGKGGVVVIFNMNPGRPTEGWNQIMTLPRRLTLLSKEELGQEPAGDITSLRYNNQHIGTRILPANKEIVLENIKGNALEISTEIDPKNAQLIELNVLRSPNKEEYTRIIFFKEKGFNKGLEYRSGSGTAAMPADLVRLFTGEPPAPRTPTVPASLITIESSYSSTLPDAKIRAPETAPVFLSPGETINLRVFIDKSVVEVFVNGKQCVAMRVYPGRDDSTGFSIRAQGQEAELKSLDAWQMKNIYE
ncbi:glycosyl hydrolase family 32 domain protein [Adhaeribacter arboris]|uniref:beta-fructofuranosidase n=1 Tax=Adhaeribacter arboris TaxID=2072846 RepID=A0A2T2YBE5_9BACT|nr:glycoside hydrolase family 32 protein [Adhaeribacter arboris]PSR52824.1 glycosyl hydrolase family 32 domain protein [Adhaeribacter arboris]